MRGVQQAGEPTYAANTTCWKRGKWLFFPFPETVELNTLPVALVEGM